MISTNTVKVNFDDKPKPLRHVRVDDLGSKVGAFNFNAGKFKEARPAHPSAFARGPLQTSQLREMAENKKRLEVSAARKAAEAAARAKALAEGKPAPKRRKGRKARKGK